MAFPRKKIYRSGSPGSIRELAETTLTKIKKLIATSSSPTKTRRDFQSRQLLG